jgi:hypothetical protein
MNTMNRSFGHRVISAILIVGLIWLTAGAAFAAADDAERGICMEALRRCLGEAIIPGLLGGIPALITALGFCLVGYDFCLRYVDEAI